MMNFSRILGKKLWSALFAGCLCFSISSYGNDNDSSSSASQPSAAAELENESSILDVKANNTKSISVVDTISDAPIQKRIQNILATSEWFSNLHTISSEGVVILSGSTRKQEYREWAGNIAARTEGVVAVINKIAIETEAQNSFSPVVRESQLLWRKTVKALPSLGVSCAVLLVFFIIARYVSALSLRLTQKKIPSLMLRRLIANLAAVPVIIIGIYLVLRITGLSKMATTIIGGTGLVGLVLGFAFKDIVENFLASMLISIQRPFRLGETIRVLDYTGVVQAVTTRGTVIMTLEGNHVQIPNTIIYKEAIVNFSANPHLRLDFMVGIGYDASISDAQRIALNVLVDHPAVLASPEPWVLAEALSAATVNLRIYFWVNNNVHNALKVKSAVIRNIKFAFLNENISMPDDAREVIFPQGIRIISDVANQTNASIEMKQKSGKPISAGIKGDDKKSTEAEGNLDTDIPNIKSQASQYALDDGNTNLLNNKET